MVCLLVLPSGSFLGIGALLFSKFWHDVRNPWDVVHGQAGFFEYMKENIFAPKWGKWAKNRVFGIY